MRPRPKKVKRVSKITSEAVKLYATIYSLEKRAMKDRERLEKIRLRIPDEEIEYFVSKTNY